MRFESLRYQQKHGTHSCLAFVATLAIAAIVDLNEPCYAGVPVAAAVVVVVVAEFHLQLKHYQSRL